MPHQSVLPENRMSLSMSTSVPTTLSMLNTTWAALVDCLRFHHPNVIRQVGKSLDTFLDSSFGQIRASFNSTLCGIIHSIKSTL